MDVIISGVKGSIMSKAPGQLLASMKARMAQKELKGKIRTWECDKDGDFRYLAQQYDGIAWVRPAITGSSIDLKLVWPQGSEPSQEIKGIYLGRFVEMVIGHFSAADFSEAKAFPFS